MIARGQILLELPAAEAIRRLDEIEDAYIRGTSEPKKTTSSGNAGRTRRKQSCQPVHERELARLTGKIVSTRREEDDEYYFDAELQRRELVAKGEEVADHGLPHRKFRPSPSTSSPRSRSSSG